MFFVDGGSLLAYPLFDPIAKCFTIDVQRTAVFHYAGDVVAQLGAVVASQQTKHRVDAERDPTAGQGAL